MILQAREILWIQAMAQVLETFFGLTQGGNSYSNVTICTRELVTLRLLQLGLVGSLSEDVKKNIKKTPSPKWHGFKRIITNE